MKINRCFVYETVENVMQRHFVILSPDTLLFEAQQRLDTQQTRCLVVVTEQTVVGLVTTRNIEQAKPSDKRLVSIRELDYLLGQTRVDQVMTPHPITIRNNVTIRDAAQTMLRHHVDALPVLDADQHLVGLITTSELLQLIAQEHLQAVCCSTDMKQYLQTRYS